MAKKRTDVGVYEALQGAKPLTKHGAERAAKVLLARYSGQPLKLSERDIERTCTDFLALDGWRCIQTDLPHLRGLGVQEKGMADRLYLRYAISVAASAPLIPTCQALAQVMWIEWKSKRGVIAPHQKLWHVAERARGALTLITGEDFPKSIEGFQEWYRKSGLLRRAGL